MPNASTTIQDVASVDLSKYRDEGRPSPPPLLLALSIIADLEKRIALAVQAKGGATAAPVPSSVGDDDELMSRLQALSPPDAIVNVPQTRQRARELEHPGVEEETPKRSKT